MQKFFESRTGCVKMEYTFSKTEIRHLWRQIVQQEGLNKYTPAEWQESFDDFCRCMLSNSEPFIKVDTLDNLTEGIVKTHPVFPSQSTVPSQSSVQAQSIVREDTPRVFPGQAPQTPQPLPDKFNEQWQLGAASQQRSVADPKKRIGLQSQPMESVPYQIQNNPQQFEEAPQRPHSQWTRPHSQDVLTQPQQQQQQQPQLNRPPSHEFLIPRLPQLDPFKSVKRRNHSENAYQCQPQNPVTNFKQPGEHISLQEMYEQNRVRAPLTVPNINADISKINSQGKTEVNSPPKRQRLDTKDQISIQHIYEQNRIRKPLSIPNINADMTKINSKMITEAASHITENTSLIADVMQLANVEGEKGALQDVKITTSVVNKKAQPIDDWLQNFTSNETDHKIADTSDFFKNLANPSKVIGKTSDELKAVLNNMPKGNKIPKKSKKKRNKNKSK